MLKSRRLVVYNWLTRILPESRFSKCLRVFLLKWAGVRIGKAFELGEGVVIRGKGCVEFGDNVKLYDGIYIICKPGGLVKVGNNSLLATRVYIESGGVVSVGNNSFIMQDSFLTANCGSRMIVGNYCQIAHMVSLKTSTHEISPDYVCIAGQDKFEDIVIGDGVWLCAGVIVIPGVKIGNKVIAAAGAVVTKDVDDYCLVAGVPAKVKKIINQND